MRHLSSIVLILLLVAVVGLGCRDGYVADDTGAPSAGPADGGDNGDGGDADGDDSGEVQESYEKSIDVKPYFHTTFLDVYGSSSLKLLHTDALSGVSGELLMEGSKVAYDNGDTLYVKSYSDSLGNPYGQQFFIIDAEVGVFIAGGTDESGNEYKYEPGIPILFMTFEPGKEYNITAKRIQGDDVQDVDGTLRIDPSIVTGPTGTYDDCYRSTLTLNLGSTIIRDIRWYARNVGLVRHEYRGSVSFDRELSYQVYEETFDDGPSDWYTVSGYEHDEDYETWAEFAFAPGETPLMTWAMEDGDGYVESHSPWWVDPHHRPPGGYGYLNLLGWTWLDSYRENSLQGLQLNVLDLTNGVLEINVLLSPDMDLKGAHVVFWFQVYLNHDPLYGQYVNFALTAYPIESLATIGEWTKIVLPLKPIDSDWTCMGAAVERSGKYGCVSVAEAMRAVNADFGFIAIPISDPNDPPTGSIRISDVRISHRQ